MSSLNESVVSENSGISSFLINMNHLNEMHKKNILEEKYYLLNSNFDLGNYSFTIHCGLSGARGFEPAIKLVHTMDGTNISFNDNEWMVFISHLRYFMDNFCENNDATQEDYLIDLPSDEDIKIQACRLLGSKVIKVTSSVCLPTTSFYLSEQVIEQIIKVNALLIKKRVEMLQHLNFFMFYTNFIDIINKIIYQSNYELNAESVVTAFCDILTNCTLSYCMRECWYFYKNKFLADLEYGDIRRTI